MLLPPVWDELRPEAQVLLVCSGVRMDNGHLRAAADVLRGLGRSFDWGWFTEQATRHKVLALVARNLELHGLYGAAGPSGWETPFRWLLNAGYRYQQQRNLALYGELRTVLHHLHAAGVTPLVRKGGVLAQEVYGDAGTRPMSDLDLLVPADQVETLAGVLATLGYAQGRVSATRRVLEPEDRTKGVYWRLYMNNLLPFIRLAGLPEVERFEVDVCLNLFLPKSGLSLPAANLLPRRRAVVLNGQPAWTLGVPDLLLDLCGHLYKEATTTWWIAAGKDLNLIKFCDVASYVAWAGDRLDWADFVALVTQHGLQRPAHYALHFTNQLYPGTGPDHVLAAIAPDDLGYLDQFGEVDGGIARSWQAGFAQRLFDSGRAAVAGPSKAPI